MSYCACWCTVNAPSGCAASQDLQCVHVRNTQHSLPVEVEGYTRCDPCLLAPACCNQHIGRTPSGTKEMGQQRRASRSGGVDIYDKCLELTHHLRVSSWKVVSGCTSRPLASHRHPPLCWSADMVLAMRTQKVGREKNDTESCLICCVNRRWMMDTITHL